MKNQYRLGLSHHRPDSQTLPAVDSSVAVSGGGLRRRGAILSMELVLILPIFLMLILSMAEFSMLMSARTRVCDAARQGSRMLCLGGQSPDQIRSQLVAILGSGMGRQCQIEIQPAAGPGDLGNVQIRVPMHCATPDLLWMTGFSVRNRFLEADAPMVMERQIALNRTASNQIGRF